MQFLVFFLYQRIVNIFLCRKKGKKEEKDRIKKGENREKKEKKTVAYIFPSKFK